jgi:hypothetical protein
VRNEWGFIVRCSLAFPFVLGQGKPVSPFLVLCLYEHFAP